MKIKFLFFLFITYTIQLAAQKNATSEPFGDKIIFSQFEITIPLKGNDTYGEIDDYGNRSDYMIVPDGISTKFGYGIHHNKWIGLSIHSGIDWKITPKLVSVPVYAQVTFNPIISGETRLLIQSGFGQSFALGRGSLSGNYYKARLGITTDSDISVFLDASFYGFEIHQQEMGSFSLGFSLMTF